MARIEGVSGPPKNQNRRPLREGRRLNGCQLGSGQKKHSANRFLPQRIVVSRRLYARRCFGQGALA